MEPRPTIIRGGTAHAHPIDVPYDPVRSLPFLVPSMTVSLLIRAITSRIWPEDDWRMIKPELRRALEIRRDLSRAPWWN